MSTLKLARTDELDPAALEAARALLEEVFLGDWVDSDWQHCLGGAHALSWQGEVLVGHAALVPRTLWCGGRALRTGYVEGVGVRVAARRRGVASALLAALETGLRAHYELGALSATEEARPLYEGRGWQRWRGPLSARSPEGRLPTPKDAGTIYVLPLAAPLDLDAELSCDWRAGDLW